MWHCSYNFLNSGWFNWIPIISAFIIYVKITNVVYSLLIFKTLMEKNYSPNILRIITSIHYSEIITLTWIEQINIETTIILNCMLPIIVCTIFYHTVIQILIFHIKFSMIVHIKKSFLGGCFSIIIVTGKNLVLHHLQISYPTLRGAHRGKFYLQ